MVAVAYSVCELGIGVGQRALFIPGHWLFIPGHWTVACGADFGGPGLAQSCHGDV